MAQSQVLSAHNFSHRVMETNIGNSVYKPRFFEPFFTKLNGATIPFGDDQTAIELLLAQKEYSFAYLRNGELRTLEAYNASDEIKHSAKYWRNKIIARICREPVLEVNLKVCKRTTKRRESVDIL